jgi:hypothetical protein
MLRQRQVVSFGKLPLLRNLLQSCRFWLHLLQLLLQHANLFLLQTFPQNFDLIYSCHQINSKQALFVVALALHLTDLVLIEHNELVALGNSGFSFKLKSVDFAAKFENKCLLHTRFIVLNV